jgi:hypothetical protein
MELITKQSGLTKTITHTIRVICRVNFKTVRMYKNSVVQSVINSYRQVRTVNLFPQTLNLTLIWDVRFAGCGLQRRVGPSGKVSHRDHILPLQTNYSWSE